MYHKSFDRASVAFNIALIYHQKFCLVTYISIMIYYGLNVEFHFMSKLGVKFEFVKFQGLTLNLIPKKPFQMLIEIEKIIPQSYHLFLNQ